jgi:hypothetical protein
MCQNHVNPTKYQQLSTQKKPSQILSVFRYFIFFSKLTEIRPIRGYILPSTYTCISSSNHLKNFHSIYKRFIPRLLTDSASDVWVICHHMWWEEEEVVAYFKAVTISWYCTEVAVKTQENQKPQPGQVISEPNTSWIQLHIVTAALACSGIVREDEPNG